METISNRDPLYEDVISKRILDAAIAIINEEGFENLTIRRVAKESGCSNSAIYMRFEDKEALGNAVASLQAKPILLIMDEEYSEHDNFLVNIQRISKEILKKVYQMDIGAVLMQMRYRGESLGTNKNPFMNRLESYIRAAILNGEIKTGNPNVLAATFETSFWGLAYMCRLDIDMTIERAIDILETHNQILYDGIHKKNEDDQFWDELKNKGVDVDKALERMKGNKDAYRSFLSEFFGDPDFIMLRESIAKEDAEEAFEYAHGLKGMAANLGLDEIYNNISILVEILRQGTTIGAKEAYDIVMNACDIIKDLL